MAPDYPLIDVEETYGGKAGLFYGSRHEHTDSGQLIEYLQTVSEGEVSLFAEPPTVHIGQDSGHRQEVLRAVQWLNETLPLEWQDWKRCPSTEYNCAERLHHVDIGNAEALVLGLAARLYDSTDPSVAFREGPKPSFVLLHSLGFRMSIAKTPACSHPRLGGRIQP